MDAMIEIDKNIYIKAHYKFKKIERSNVKDYLYVLYFIVIHLFYIL